ncbi:MAG: hypothetical protein ACRYG8_41575, partial [Janthinobacterium lividum]
MSGTRIFGRRSSTPNTRSDTLPGTDILMPATAALVSAEPARVLPVTQSSDEALREVRRLCLARIDPAAIANLTSDRLLIDMEHLISELA